MAATCRPREVEELLARGQSFRSITGKRNQSESPGLDYSGSGKLLGCEKDGFQGVFRKRTTSVPMAASAPLRSLDKGMERNIPYEVSALRQAAAAAVAEFNGPLGPSLQLTEPDKSHEIKQQPQLSSSQPGTSHSQGEPRRPERISSSHALQQRLEDLKSLHDPSVGSVFTQRGCPPHGAKAICGRRPRMEDAYTAVPFLLEVPVPAAKLAQSEIMPARIAPQLRSAANSPSVSDAEGPPREEADGRPLRQDQGRENEDSTASEESYLETLHFFGVFDGHGGAEAALHCAQTLHQRIAEALAAATEPEGDAAPTGGTDESPAHDNAGLDSDNLVSRPSGLPAVLPSVEEDNSEEERDLVDDALKAEGQDVQDGLKEGVACTSGLFESALTSAFNRTDEEFGKADNAALVGTTAVVALVGSRQLYVANCGDSRAVLCRAGQAIPLTDDHKAAREDETARVEAAGGHILYWNGVRVMGVLAVSRAIGDHCLRPFVISEPEVTILVRRPDDEILLMASDGLWDVLNNSEACTLAKRCLRRARQRGASRQSAARIAATVLTRAAVDRGSRDNVTVLVVDLSVGDVEADDMSRAQSAVIPDKGPNDNQNSQDRMSRVQSQALGN